MKRKVYQELASRILAQNNCIESDNWEWEEKHGNVAGYIVENYLPSGSGISEIEEISFAGHDKIVFHSSYHLMDENGMYDGWLKFKVVVKPSLVCGITVDVIGNFSQKGGKYSYLKDYLTEEFDRQLQTEIDIKEVAKKAEEEYELT